VEFRAIVGVAPESDLFWARRQYAPAMPCQLAAVARFLDTFTVNPMSFVAAPGLTTCAGLARSKADSQATVATVACVSLCALVLVAPFEALRPLVTVPGQTLSTVEGALVAALAAWALALLATRTVPIWRSPLTLPWLVFLGAMTLAAVTAPVHRANAVNMVGRGVLAFLVFLMTLNGITSQRRIVGVMLAIALSGMLVWPLVLLEYAQVSPIMAFLSLFRAFSANVGGALRAGGPFQYPTIASMYLEVVFCVALGIFLLSIDRRKFGGSVLIGIVLVAVGQSINLTSSRAGLAVMLAALTLVGLVRFRAIGFDPGVQGLLAVAAVIGIQFPTTSSFQNFGLRLTTEGQNAWYSASFDVPIEVSLPTESIIKIPIRVTNTGLTVWNSAVTPPIRLSYHMLLEDDRVWSWQGPRTDFPRPVPPGESITVNAAVEAPLKPGRYRIMWDIEREGWLWFSTEPGAGLFVTNAVVTGPEVSRVRDLDVAKLPSGPKRPGRLLLWRAALGIFFAHPITGVGPDNYRLAYGPYAGLANFDTRVHSNNMYLEILAGAGLVGATAFAWLCYGISGLIVATLRSRRDPCVGAVVAGVLTAVAAIAVHGGVDSFLSFTPTYVLFSVTLGLMAALSRLIHCDAHRI
jgi:O-Antigen ligase